MILDFCRWLTATTLGESVRASKWSFPIIEIVHLLGLGILGGTLLIVDMRLFGMRRQPEPAAELWKDVQPWMVGGLLTALFSGFILFASEADQMYYNDAFRFKMASLALAMIFTFTVHRKVSLSEAAVSPLARKLVVLVSLLLWSGVGWGGRMIGYLQ